MFSLNHQEPLQGNQEHTSNGHVTSRNLWETIWTSRATRGGHSSMWATEKEAVERNGLLNISEQRNQKFEMYKIEAVNDEMSLESEKMDMTEWLKENVKEEKYVVMKVEAEVVEEMMRSKSIKMVDELLLECKPKGLGLRGRKMQSKSGRAYWECLALYGKLRDEGVAVLKINN